MAVDPKVKNRLEYILRTPKERRKLKKLFLSTQKHLKKEWHSLSDPSSDVTEDDRTLITVMAEFTAKGLATIEFLEQNSEVNGEPLRSSQIKSEFVKPSQGK